jgi:hypothetical protein
MLDNVPNSCLVNFGNLTVRSLIDSGSSVSLINKKIFEKLKPKPKLSKTKICLKTVDNKQVNVLGFISVEVKLNNLKIFHQFVVVSNISQNVILGKDFLNSNGCRIFYDINCLMIQNVKVPMQNDREISSILRSKKNVILKPFSVNTIQCKVKERSALYKNKCYDICSLETGFISKTQHVHLQSKSVRFQAQNIPVVITNTSNKHVKLKRGCTIGRLINDTYGSLDSVQIS